MLLKTKSSNWIMSTLQGPGTRPLDSPIHCKMCLVLQSPKKKYKLKDRVHLSSPDGMVLEFTNLLGKEIQVRTSINSVAHTFDIQLVLE